MRIIALSTLRDFWLRHAGAEDTLRAWHSEAETAVWQSPQDIKDHYANASILPDNRVVFNIRGNTYRLVVKIHFNTRVVYIRFIGTHREYDTIDATSV